MNAQQDRPASGEDVRDAVRLLHASRRVTQASRVLDYLWSVAPFGATNSQIRQHLGLASHQTVYMVTRQLLRLRLVRAERHDREWVFHAVEDQSDVVSPPSDRLTGGSTETSKLSPHGFEALARRVLSAHFGTSLAPGSVPPVSKLFDLASSPSWSSATIGACRSDGSSAMATW